MTFLRNLSARFPLPTFVAIFAPAAMAQYQGHELWSETGVQGQGLGRSAANAGDVNGDGYDDVIAGSPLADVGGTDSGMAQVFSGVDGSVLYQFSGAAQDAYLGQGVAGAGDVNADGNDDFLIRSGAFNSAVRLHSGLDGSVLHTFSPPATNVWSSASTSSVGDVDGDGVLDVLTGFIPAHFSSIDEGVVRVRSGASGGVILEISGQSRSFGEDLCGPGDLDGDGLADLVIVDHYKAYVYSATGALLGVVDDSGQFNGNPRYVAAVGDLDGDGVGDFVIGHSGHHDLQDVLRGRATAYSGATRAQLFSWYGDILANNTGHGGFGRSVSGAGDFDGDGVGDVIVGDYSGGEGSAFVYSGSSGGLLATFLGDPTYGSDFGFIVGGGGDTNGDGFADVLVCDASYELTWHSGEGHFVVFSGGHDPEVYYCDSLPNSTGGAAAISVSGSTSVSANDLVLSASPVPNTPGIFFLGPDQVDLPFGDGVRCVGGSIQRLPVSVASANTLTTTVDNTWSALNGAVAPGTLLNFQAWFRDTAAGGAGFNTSGAVRLQFQP